MSGCGCGSCGCGGYCEVQNSHPAVSVSKSTSPIAET